LLEAGKRADAEQALEAIRAKTEERSWEARIGLLLASDDLRRKDYPAAVRRLRLAPAAAIGLEPYRRSLLARALAAAGLNVEAAREARIAFETEEPFAGRAAAGRTLASALEKAGDPRGAAAALETASGAASRAEAASIAADRIRITLTAGDQAGVRSAARQILFSGVSLDGLPAAARAAVAREETRLGPADRGKAGAALLAAGNVERGVRLLRKDP